MSGKFPDHSSAVAVPARRTRSPLSPAPRSSRSLVYPCCVLFLLFPFFPDWKHSIFSYNPSRPRTAFLRIPQAHCCGLYGSLLGLTFGKRREGPLMFSSFVFRDLVSPPRDSPPNCEMSFCRCVLGAWNCALLSFFNTNEIRVPAYAFFFLSSWHCPWCGRGPPKDQPRNPRLLRPPATISCFLISLRNMGPTWLGLAGFRLPRNHSVCRLPRMQVDGRGTRPRPVPFFVRTAQYLVIAPLKLFCLLPSCLPGFDSVIRFPNLRSAAHFLVFLFCSDHSSTDRHPESDIAFLAVDVVAYLLLFPLVMFATFLLQVLLLSSGSDSPL